MTRDIRFYAVTSDGRIRVDATDFGEAVARVMESPYLRTRITRLVKEERTSYPMERAAH